MRKTSIDFEKALNPEQLAAVTHGEEPLLVIAGAGSGKTRAITYRVAWLIQEHGVEPEAIAALTFTNKAAAEMRDRLEELLGVHPLPSFVGTFHRFALRLLRHSGNRVGLPRDFVILDSSDQHSLIKKAMKRAEMAEENLKPPALLHAISSAKNKLIGPIEYERQAADFWSRNVAKVYHHYQTLLREAGGVDFDDMIRLSWELLHKNEGVRRRSRERLRYLLVDEFQDTNFAQMALIRELLGERGHLTAVGDEDQGIYRWRGAELSNILAFERHFPGAATKKLERNYRSTQNILDAAGAVVARNQQRRGKNLWTDAGAGEKLVLYRARDEQDEARWLVTSLVGLERALGWRQMAILVRTNAQSRPLEEEFLRRQLPYTLVAGVRFYERAEVKDLIAYLRLVRRPDDPLSMARVLNVPTRGIGKSTQDGLEKLADRLGGSMWQALQDDRALELSFPVRAANALREFRALLRTLIEEAEQVALPTLLRLILDRTKFLQQYDAKDPEDKARLENIDELLTAAQEFTEANALGGDDLLGGFLDHVSLVAETDGLGGPGVSIMTLHAAKGLEFGVVAIAGLEEGLLPHFNAKNADEDLEEERRLLYVGMTRAKERLLLTTCKRRRVAGTWQEQEASRFLDEIPGNYLRVEVSPELYGNYGGSSGGYGSGYGGYGGGFGGGGYGGGLFDRDDRAPMHRRESYATTQRGGWNSEPAEKPASRPAAAPVEAPAPPASATTNVLSFFGKPASAVTAATTEPLPFAEASNPTLPEPLRVRNPLEPKSGAADRMKRGARVRHQKLGIGRVLGIEGSGDNAKIEVFFEGVGTRKLVAKFAHLEVL
jgi:DNA helicase-2/ATP-dependent DNA helicase PcrA